MEPPMFRPLLLPVLFSGLLLAGCPTMPEAPPETAATKEASLVESGRFPVTVGGYTRGEIEVIDHRTPQYLVQYHRFDGFMQNSVTLHFYPAERRLAKQYRYVSEAILAAHPNSILLSERQLVLQRGDAEFPTYITSFRYSERFAEVQQTVISQLVLISLPDRFVQVRSTAPERQSPAAEEAMLDLLDAVDWAY
jgi:hypothetical protein